MVVILSDNDQDPPDGYPWILIENDDSGSWYGTGFGVDKNGKDTMYISRTENDKSYVAAIDSASAWAMQNNVEVIYVREI